MLVSLQNIKSKNDNWFLLSQLLLEHKNIDVNAECGSVRGYMSHILSSICKTQCESTFGVELLLEDSRTDVNIGLNTPLYCALSNVETKDDYFYQVAKLLLNHTTIKSILTLGILV